MQCIKSALIFAGGSGLVPSCMESVLDNADYVICADSGIAYCHKLGLKAHLWVGDFDSADFDSYISLPFLENTEIIKLNPIKDATDTEFALECAINRGYTDISLIGAVGSRIDHSLANIFLMEKYIRNNVKIRIINENNIIHLVSDGTITIKRGEMKYISVLPLETVKVSNEGFVYPLKNETMYRYSSRGISNELTEETGIIKVTGGSALVIESKD